MPPLNIYHSRLYPVDWLAASYHQPNEWTIETEYSTSAPGIHSVLTLCWIRKLTLEPPDAVHSCDPVDLGEFCCQASPAQTSGQL